jgi:hypothetical protein
MAGGNHIAGAEARAAAASKAPMSASETAA